MEFKKISNITTAHTWELLDRHDENLWSPDSLPPISADLIAATALSDLHDIAKVAPNSFAAAGFGAPSLPTIRGQLGEVLQNGMRRQGAIGVHDGTISTCAAIFNNS